MRRKRNRLRIGRVVFALFLISLIIGLIIYAVNIISLEGEMEVNGFQRERVYNMVENPVAVAKVEDYLSTPDEINLEASKAEALERINDFKVNYEYNIYNSKDGQKIAYLTFDDGPSTKSTPEILKVLDDYNIKATFFMLGKNAEMYPEIVKEVYDKGHKIANHSYGHDYKYLYRNLDNLIKDIYKCDQVYKEILGEDFNTKLFRFPGGCYGEKKRAMRRALLEKEGYVSYNWNSLNGDSEGKIFSKDHLIKRFNETRGQDKLIILMHDTNAKHTTPEALPEMIEILIKEGYSFGTLPE